MPLLETRILPVTKKKRHCKMPLPGYYVTVAYRALQRFSSLPDSTISAAPVSLGSRSLHFKGGSICGSFEFSNLATPLPVRAATMFTLNLKRYTVTRSDGAQEDDFPVWARVHCAGAGAASVWYTADADAQLATTLVRSKSSVSDTTGAHHTHSSPATPLPTQNCISLPQPCNGPSGNFNYARVAKEGAAPLTETQLTQLASTRCIVALHKGGTRDGSRDPLLGWVELPVTAFLASGRVQLAAAPLQPPTSWPSCIAAPAGGRADGYSGAVAVGMKASVWLQELLLGGRLLTFPGLRITAIPDAWRLSGASALEPAAVAAACASGDSSPTAFVLSLALPNGRQAHVGGGSLAYVRCRHPTPVGKGNEEEEGMEGDGNATASSSTTSSSSTGVRKVTSAPAAKGTPIASPAPVTSATPTAVKAAAALPPSGKGTAPPGETKDAKTAREAAAVEAERVRLAAEHADYEWEVQWGGAPTPVFLSASSVASLWGPVACGGGSSSIRAVVHRVIVEPAAEHTDTVFALPRGLRLVEEDYSARGEVTLPLHALWGAGVTDTAGAEGGVAVTPAPPVSAEMMAVDAAAAVQRSAEWAAECSARASAAAAAAGGMTGGGGEKGKAKASAQGKAGGAPPASSGGAAAAASTVSAAPATAGGASGGKSAAKPLGGKAGAAAASSTTAAAPADHTSPPPSVHAYASAGTRLFWSARLDRPIRPSAVAQPAHREATVGELVALRGPAPAAPPRPDATQRFRDVVTASVADVLRAHAATMASSSPTSSGGAYAAAPTSSEDRADALMRVLRESGAYATLTQQVQQCAREVVRERFQGLPGFDSSDPSEASLLTARVYDYLMAHTAVAVNSATVPAADSVLAPPVVGGGWVGAGSRGRRGSLDGLAFPTRRPSTTVPSTPTTTTSANTTLISASPTTPVPSEAALRWRRLAREAEYSGNLTRAAAFHRSRIAAGEKAAAAGLSNGVYDADSWCDFGAALLRWRAIDRAAVALREAVSINPTHITALALLATLELAAGRTAPAAAFASAAIRAVVAQRGAPHNVLPVLYTLRSLALQAGEALTTAPSSAATTTTTTPTSIASPKRGAAAVDGQGADGGAGSELRRAVRAFKVALREAVHGAADAGMNGNILASPTSTPSSDESDDDDDDDDDADATASSLIACPAAVYLATARFALDAGVPLVARKCCELAGNAIGDGADALPEHQAELHVLRARVLLSSLNADVSLPPQEKAAGEERQSRGGLPLPHPLTLTFTVGTPPVPLSAAGAAYDGALMSLEAAEAALCRACELDPVCADAWEALAYATWARAAPEWGVQQGGGEAGVALPTPLSHGLPDAGELSLEQAVEVARLLELAEEAAAGACPPVSIGAVSTATPFPTPLHTSAGLGGALLGGDEFAPTRRLLRLGECLLRVAELTADVGGGGVRGGGGEGSALVRARAAFSRAVAASTPPLAVTAAAAATSTARWASAPSIPTKQAPSALEGATGGGGGGGGWTAAYAGLGRASLASGGDPHTAGLLFEAANARDPSDPEAWAWLAYTSLVASPPRVQDGVGAAQQALRLGVAGDSAGRVELLHRLGQLFGKRGLAGLAGSLVSRAVAVGGSNGGGRLRGPSHAAAVEAAMETQREQRGEE